MPVDQSLVSSLPFFSLLPEEEIRALAGQLSFYSYPPGVLLFREGEEGDRFSIILAGQVEIVQALGTAEERILSLLEKGQFLGEMSLFDPHRRRSAAARTRTTVDLLEMTFSDYEALLNRQPRLVFRMMQEISMRMRNSEGATIRDLQAKNQELAEAYLELKAAQAGLIEKEKIEHELNVARRIQARILPKELPALPGWEIAAHWQPARAVSGDFYDFLYLPDGRLGIVIGDVTDKGVPAALVMATTRAILRGVAGDGKSPGEVLARANELLCPDMPESMFVTCLYAILDPHTGDLQFANAGHCLPTLLAQEGLSELNARGMPLGLLPGMNYPEAQAGLAVGDALLLYSDGLVEAHNPAGEMFGLPRLRLLLQDALRADPARQCIASLLADQRRFTGEVWEQEDDVTVVVLRRRLSA